MKWKMTAIFVVVLLLVARKPSAEESPFLTGVHLQAMFEVPDQIEGEAPSHEQMDYLLYLPEGYGRDPEKQWPLIFFLHGAGDDDNDSGFVMSFGLPEVLYKKEQPENFPFIVVSPQAFPNWAWWSGDTLVILNALLDEVIDTYQVDPDRVYLTGLSMGGYGSWHLATAYPERFAAMVSISGSGYRTPSIPSEETLCRLQDLPVWAIHGAQDPISAPEGSRLYADALEVACNSEVKWTLYPDAGHFQAYARAYRDPALYNWLLEHSR